MSTGDKPNCVVIGDPIQPDSGLPKLGSATAEADPDPAPASPMNSAEIEQYLQSTEAEQDIAAEIARVREGDISARWTITNGVIGDSSNPWLMAFCMGASEETEDDDGEPVCRTLPGEPIITYPTHASVKVYFRGDNARGYLVGDIGEAMRAFRLRTGYAADFGAARGPERERLHDAAFAAIGKNSRVELCLDGQLRAVDATSPAGLIAAADLPRAICRVMLAAFRVGRVEAAR